MFTLFLAVAIFGTLWNFELAGRIVCSVLAGFLILRLFVIYHDQQHQAILSKSVTNKGERPHYLRGHLEAGRFIPFGNQESHALFGLSRANALLRIGAGEQIPEHQTVEVVLLA